MSVNIKMLCFRLCSTSDKGFYHGRELGFTGIIKPGILSTNVNIATIIANKLGSSLLRIPSRGARGLGKGKRPKKKNTLGIVCGFIFHDKKDKLKY